LAKLSISKILQHGSPQRCSTKSKVKNSIYR